MPVSTSFSALIAALTLATVYAPVTDSSALTISSASTKPNWLKLPTPPETAEPYFDKMALYRFIVGVFVTSGTTTALQHQVPAYTACLIGMTVGIGGGAIRDVLLREIPMVLRKEIYAVAALAGAVVVAVTAWLGLPDLWGTVIGSGLVVAIRLTALWRHWNAPVPRAGGTAES